jgi:hypothetical protein
VLMLTELGIDRRCGATGPASRSGGSGTAELVEVTLPGSPGLLVSTGQCVVVLRSRQRGKRGRSGTGSKEFPGIGFTCGGGSERNSGACKPKAEGSGLRVGPGHETELLRRLCGLWCGGAAGLRRRRKSTLAQRVWRWC